MNPSKCYVGRGNKKYNLKDILSVVEDNVSVKVDVDYFKSLLHENFWFDPRKEVTVNDVLHHMDRIKNADLKYPIVVLKHDEPDILDGIHRLAKAVNSGVSHIDVVYITQSELDEISTGIKKGALDGR